RPENFVVSKKESPVFREFDLVISAIGSRPQLPVTKARGIFYAGDMVLGAGTVVESVASGKNAATEAEAFIRGKVRPKFKNRAKSRVLLAGVPLRPVPLDTDFFDRRILSPFLLSAAPHSTTCRFTFPPATCSRSRARPTAIATTSPAIRSTASAAKSKSSSRNSLI